MKESTIHAIAVGLLFSAILYGSKKKRKNQIDGVSGIVKIPSDYTIPYNLIRKSDINGEFARYINDTIKLSDEGAKRVTAREIRAFVDTLSPKEKAITSKWGYESDLYDKTDILNHFAPIPKEPTKEERKKRIKKGKELNPYNYVSKGKENPRLQGVFYQDGFRYASDARILLCEAWEYPQEYEGKLIAKDGKEIPEKPLPYQSILSRQQGLEKADINIDEFIAEVEEKKGRKYPKDWDYKEYNPSDYNIVIWNEDEKVLYSPRYAKEILDFLRVYPNSEFYFTIPTRNRTPKSECPLLIKSDDNFLFIMPMRY